MITAPQYKDMVKIYLRGTHNPLSVLDTDEDGTYEYEGKIKPKERPRFDKKSGRAFTPKDTVDFEKSIKKWAHENGIAPVAHPIRVTLRLREEAPDVNHIVHGALGLTYPIRGDVDNMAKGILDALNKIAYTDDKLINQLDVDRRWSHKSGFTLTMERCGLSRYEYENFCKYLKVAQ